MEIDLAADRRHAEGIAVAADAGDDAGDQMPGLRMVGRAEAQRVQRRDRPRAHGEDVAQDAADAGRRALVGLDEGGVVVALHLEDDAAPSPMSTTPAFSPGPWMTRGPVVGSVRSQFFEDLYEQCSFHIAEKMPSSVSVGSRPIRSRMRWYSSGFSPCAATRSGVIAAGAFIAGNRPPKHQRSLSQTRSSKAGENSKEHHRDDSRVTAVLAKLFVEALASN